MTRLAFLLFAVIGTTLMGTFIVIALALGFDTVRPIIIAAASGFIVAIPASYIIANKLLNNSDDHHNLGAH